MVNQHSTSEENSTSEKANDTWEVLEQPSQETDQSLLLETYAVREIAYRHWNVQPQPYPFRSVQDGKLRSVKCTFYVESNVQYKYGQTKYWQRAEPTPATPPLNTDRQAPSKRLDTSCEFEQESDTEFHPFFNIQPYNEDIKDVPHVCERVIYFLQTDDEEWELKREYQDHLNQESASLS